MGNRTELNEIMISMVKAALHNEKFDCSFLNDTDLEQLLKLCRFHGISALAAYGMKEPNEGWKQELLKNIRRTALFDAERKKILSEMDRHHIWHCCLKGSVLKDYYPEYGLREFSDNDILFDPRYANELRTIMESLGYMTEQFMIGNHDVYHKEPVFNFEMHRALFDSFYGVESSQYFTSVEENLLIDPKNENDRYFSDDDFYIYILAHMHKHFAGSGTGLRSLIDIYVYVKSHGDLNWVYVENELKKLKIDSFEKDVRSLSLCLFDGKPLNENEQKLLGDILNAGLYGNIDFKVNRWVNDSGKIAYILSRLKVPFSPKDPKYQLTKQMHPFFYKHKILLPFLPVYRFVHSLMTNRKALMKELNVLIKAGKKDDQR